MKSYSLDPRLVPLLIPVPDSERLSAKIVAQQGKEVIIQLDTGATAKINAKDAGVVMGDSPTGTIFFDSDGKLLTVELDPPVRRNTASTSGRSGSAVARRVPDFN